jgi:multiple sugar transport system permease protein
VKGSLEEPTLRRQAWRPRWEMAEHRRLLDRVGRITIFLVVCAFTVLFVFPLVWMLITALKNTEEVFRIPPVWWPAAPQWRHITDIMNPNSKVYDIFPLWKYVWNTLLITIPTTIGTTFSSAMVAYGFSRVRWKGRDLLFYIVIATLMIPSWVTLLPQYIMFNNMGWVGTYRPLIVPNFFGDAFSIFLLRQFFLRQPQELVDAARIDGASHVRIFLQITVPLARPALSVVALFAFIYSWTDFFGPLIYLSDPDKYTLQVGLYNFFGEHLVNWPSFMGASLLVLMPVAILFLLTQKTFIQGIALTGLKG